MAINRSQRAFNLVHGTGRAAMKEILFLCHRIPYPPHKGDKIRAFHLLTALARKHTVHLGTFVDDADDWRYREIVDALCAETCYRPLPPVRARLRSLAGLLEGLPLGFPYYRDPSLQRWVDRIVRQHAIDAIVVFSSTMAPYAEHHDQVRRVLDFVDVDSEKWRQYARTAPVPARWVYAREGRRLLQAERRFAVAFDAGIFVSEAETRLFRSRAPECADRVTTVPNGVDSCYFDPQLPHADPYAGAGPRTLVFTGAMNYRANVDAVCWFVEEAWPLIRRRRPDASFFVVGRRPVREIRALARLQGVEVTGAVDDIRPYLAHAAVAVAPLRIARGIQNKVLEALAMDRPLVLTPEAAAGLLPLDPGFAPVVRTAEQLAGHTLAFLAGGEAADPHGARRYVLMNYGWRRQLDRFLALVEGQPAVPAWTTPARELIPEVPV